MSDQEEEFPLIARPDSSNLKAGEGDELSSTYRAQDLKNVKDLFENIPDDIPLNKTVLDTWRRSYLNISASIGALESNESSLHKVSREFETQLASLKKQLEKSENFPEDFDTPADLLRQEYLDAENQYMCTEERCSELSYKIRALQDDKRYLQREYDNMVKEEDFERMKYDMEQSIKEIHADHMKKVSEGRLLSNQLRDEQDFLEKQEKESLEYEEALRELKAELEGAISHPKHRMMEAEAMRKQKEEAEKLRDEAILEMNQLKEEATTLQASLEKMESQSAKLSRQSTDLQQNIGHTQDSLDDVTIQLEEARRRTMEACAEKEKFSSMMNHLKCQIVDLKIQVKRLTQERNQSIQETRKIQSGLQYLKDVVKVTQSACHNRKTQCEKLRQQLAEQLSQEREKQLRQEIEEYGMNYSQQSERVAMKSRRLEQVIQTEKDLRENLRLVHNELIELTRLISSKSAERELKSREYNKVWAGYEHVQEELKTKKAQMNDYEKTLRDTQKYLKKSTKLYEVLKKERNHYVSMLKVVQARAEKLKGTFREHETNFEKLKSTLRNKNELIHEQRQIAVKLLSERDKLVADSSKLVYVQREQAFRQDELERSVESYNRTLMQIKADIQSTQQNLDRAIHVRNSYASQLVERNDELGVLQEKILLQERAQIEGDKKFNQIERDIFLLSQLKSELERSVMVLEQKLQQCPKLEDSLMDLETQLKSTQNEVKKMEALISDPAALMHDPDTLKVKKFDPAKIGMHEHKEPVCLPRVREVAGRQIVPRQVHFQLDKLKIRLMLTERKALERNLLLESTTNLITDIQSQVLDTKDDVLELAKTVCKRRAQLREKTKEQKAAKAELLMLTHLSCDLKHRLENRQSNKVDGFIPTSNRKRGLSVEWAHFREALKINDMFSVDITERKELPAITDSQLITRPD